MNIEKVNAVKNYVQNFDHKNADENEEAIRYNKSRSSNLIAGTELVQFCIKKSKCETKIEKVYAYYPYYYKEPKKYRALGLDKPMTNDKSYHLERVKKYNI
ncbi:hypothetical protein, variant [Plasmodium falciparum FCH/4]|uniref:Uncharacterized protein n=1 Tax=Plasmodium falciparum FCH/4 TaxID=1036724 RepID=A0A024VIA4_PLAFA|nr:hypothetical protein, variant [Plasmodium falciparum FCH/4]